VIITSESPDVEIPDIPVTEYVLRHAERLADKPALIDGPSGRTMTFGELAGAIRATAAGLDARGFSKGDVFAIYSPNVPEYAVAFNGVVSVGGIVTTINPLYTTEELARQLNDCKARFLVTVAPFLDKALEAAKQCSIEEVFVFGEAPGATPFASLLRPDLPPPAVQINPSEDVCVLPYSSGTTGMPKGVMLTHKNLVANLSQCDGMDGFEGFTEKDTLIGVLPFFHIYGMVVIMKLALGNGATVVSMPRFDLQEFLELMQSYKVTVAPLVPPIVLALAKHPIIDNYDLTNIRLVFSGAAPLGAELAAQLSKRLQCPVVQGYGMTEASPVVTLTPTNDTSNPGSVGKVVPNTEVKIATLETGAALPVGEEGEVCIRGPQIMEGYLNRDDATAESIDAEHWYHTGDIGYVDENGYFFIVDRVKELIKYKGMQVAPAELEALLITHPDIADVAVIPKADEEAGELPKAYVVLKPDVTPNADSIMEFVSGRVAPHKRIRLVEFTDEIPKSASGKILRRTLIERERANSH
jgi:acyl-CoA synthetase (AMP-forming)/AMP-acid ligase II